jgi:4-amino-4-deoxy-L-arabinose transferase-like glycosyltransferase
MIKRLLLAGPAVLIISYGILNNQALALILGIGIFVLAFSRLIGPPVSFEFHQADSLLSKYQGSVFLFSALGLSVIAGWINIQERYSVITPFLWLASLVLLISAGVLHDRREPASTPSRFFDSPWKFTDWVIIIAVTLLALFLRLYRIEGTYPPFYGDEGEMADLALYPLHTHELPIDQLGPQFFGMGFLDHPGLFQYLQAADMAIFGQTEFGVRMLSVIFGTLCIPTIYLIARLYWQKMAAFMAAWLLAVSHLHIQYSRIALNNIESVWFMAASIFLIHLIYKTNNRSRQLLPLIIGLVAGLAQYFYFGSRLILVAIPFLIIPLWVQGRIGLKQIGLGVLAFIITYLPLIIFFTVNQEAFLNRFGGVFAFTPGNMHATLGPQAIWPNAIPELFLAQVQNTLGFFTTKGDRSGFYLADLPAFDLVTVFLFWFGLALIMTRARKYFEFSLLTWVGLGFFVGGVFVNDAPNGPRLIVMVPVVFLVAGAVFEKSAEFLKTLRDPIWRTALPLTVTLVLAAITLNLNYDIYFVRFPKYAPDQTNTRLANEMAAGASQYHFYVFDDTYTSINYGTIRFIARAADKHDVKSVDELPPNPINATDQRGLCTLILPIHEDVYEAVVARYPGGIREDRWDEAGRLVYIKYCVANPASS